MGLADSGGLATLIIYVLYFADMVHSCRASAMDLTLATTVDQYY